jgi:hypothetical protein
MQQKFISPTGFRFSIKRLPNVSFFIQSAQIPSISIAPIEYATPFKTLAFTGDKIQNEPFTVTIRLDEYMDSYNEIYDWMMGLTKPKSFDQHKALKEGDGLYSDATLIVLDSRQNPGLEVTFHDIFPINLSAIQMDTTQSDINYITCDITFEHNGHEVKKIG